MPDVLRDYLDFNCQLEGADKKNLPLFHLCSQDELVKYLKDRKIYDKEFCNVFKKRIIYTFYGACKYKSGNNFKARSSGDRSVCLILDIDHCTNIYRIYPVDTGAASGTVPQLREHIITWEVIERKLDLGQQKSRINKVILHCFESLENYVEGKTTEKEGKIIAKFESPVAISHISDLHKIIKDQSIADDRRFFVEVLFDEELPIMPELLKGLIASIDLLEDKDFGALLAEYRIQEFLKNSGLFYPSALEIIEEIEETIKELSIDFTKKSLQ